jgi:hypothetical protein
MDVCRSLGMSKATVDIWKRKYGDLRASEVGRCAKLRKGMPDCSSMGAY